MRRATIKVDFASGSRFSVPELEGEHPVHDTAPKRYRHLTLFQYECFLEVRLPRVKLPDDWVRRVEPRGLTSSPASRLLFEALVLALCREMSFSGVSRLVNLSVHRVVAIAKRYLELALAQAELSEVRQLAIDLLTGRR